MGNCFPSLFHARPRRPIQFNAAALVSGLPNLRPNETTTGSGCILSPPLLKSFTYSELEQATMNFSSQNLIGEGGFGYVYMGFFDEQTLSAASPESGMAVAVKKLSPTGTQGHEQWLTELGNLGRLRHRNLVKLFGYCSEGEDRLLVYEYLSKGSLQDLLFKDCSPPLSWETRVGIAIDTARVLSFLHELGLILRDIKSANILLDSDFNAKLSDLGYAIEGPTGYYGCPLMQSLFTIVFGKAHGHLIVRMSSSNVVQCVSEDKVRPSMAEVLSALRRLRLLSGSHASPSGVPSSSVGFKVDRPWLPSPSLDSVSSQRSIFPLCLSGFSSPRHVPSSPSDGPPFSLSSQSDGPPLSLRELRRQLFPRQERGSSERPIFPALASTLSPSDLPLSFLGSQSNASGPVSPSSDVPQVKSSKYNNKYPLKGALWNSY
ncbi:probable serine/threonine-protein kinase PBL18 isoform X3 [Gossypium hirsutum]|uniref:Probable serine/threonine-protein kinase PBL18 isoform X3 n=1 Tax=Gossypium hirsutum TaxID=3635 RepID=A0ABM2ZDD5_GOSHI|nr:probable serine/threonine-protein kinase PBL18 isoform X3 [Gossypium hirsutum]